MDKDGNNSTVYNKVQHWPPYTYRDYPNVAPECLQAFMDFLNTESSQTTRKAIQPWIPFCSGKCNFCYFPTELVANSNIGYYLLALKKSLNVYAETKYAKTSIFSELYLAGGTPSIMSIDQTINLLSFCEKHFNLSEDREIKITGCTHDFDYRKLKLLSEYGVDQLDLGVQTFDDNLRRKLNLRDNAKRAEQTIKTARKLGLRVSVDLMYNLPGQTLESWINDIQRTLDLDVESTDCYALDVYPETKLAAQLQSGDLPPMGDQKTEKEMHLKAYRIFQNAGYEPTCHNRFSRIAEDFKEPCFDTLGTGSGFFMGSLGKFSYVDINPAEAYIDSINRGRLPIAKLSVASIEDEMKKMMMRLYIRLPVNKEEFRKRFGIFPEEAFKTIIHKLEKRGLLEINDYEIKLTKLGDVWRYNISCEFSNSPDEAL